MITLIVFLVSFFLLTLLLIMKSMEVYRGRKIFLESFFLKCDDLILTSLLKLKTWWGHINFKNTKRVFVWVIMKVHYFVIAIKRRFDHKQSHFFIKRESPHMSKNKGSVSFFLKDISDYKKSLREGNENKK